ncbi:MAG: hypothetical protein LQ351_007259 [Letrouitia transgressa]|nr:MAG: hypothetical protein LQ351_007259 [Letrouitia transgressa]
MTTAPTSSNDTPQPRPRVAAHTDPRLSLISPTVEHVLPSNLPHHAVDSAVNDKGNPILEEMNNPRNRIHQNPISSKSKESGSRGYAKGLDKTRWPHALNVITNFSKPSPVIRGAAPAERRELEARDISRHTSTKSVNPLDIEVHLFDDSANNQKQRQRRNRDDSRDDGTLGLRPRQFESTRKAPSPPQEKKGPVINHKRASSKMTTLSPSDRPIVIGISVAPGQVAEHSLSPEGDPTPEETTTPRQDAERKPSDAPTITLTPAKTEASWSAGSGEYLGSSPWRRRAASSLYSQMTNGRTVSRQTDVPPVPTSLGMVTSPPEPSSIKRSKLQMTDAPSRVISGCTIFDEDESPSSVMRERAYSSESQRQILKRSSTDSVATRHRSQGWWNHILSPFLSRPPNFGWKDSPPHDLPVPALPTQSSLPSHPLRHEPSEKVDASVSPRPKSSGSGHSSTETDFSSLETERQAADLTMLHSPSMEHSRGLLNSEADLSDWFEGLGAAAEYYHACWHDQNNSTPYFECQNHVCIPRRAGKFGEAQAPVTTNRGLLEAEGGSGDNNSLTAPKNVFSAAFKDAARSIPVSKERPLSETTIIDDVDGTPEVYHAHAVPVVRAPAPVPAAQLAPSGPKTESDKTPDAPSSPPPPRTDSKQPPPNGSPAMTSAGASPPATTVKEKPPPPPEPSQRQPLSNFAPEEKPPKRYVAIMPPDQSRVATEQSRAAPDQPHVAYAQPGLSKASPLLEKEKPVSTNATLMDEAPKSNASQPTQKTYIINHYHHPFDRQGQQDLVTSAHLEPPPRPQWQSEKAWEIREKKQAASVGAEKKAVGLPSIRACLSRKKPKTQKQKWVLIGITAALLAMIILILVLAMTLTHRGDHMNVQSQWLNLTGFPPVPTGVSTIVQPDAVIHDSSCIQPSTLWSCAVPKEQQSSIAPNSPDQPNFRVEIRFQNSSSLLSNGTRINRRSSQRAANAVFARSLIKNRILQIRDTFTDSLFTPSPAPPVREDQIFLGNTTEKNQQPFDGEPTPFYITFLNPDKLPSSRLVKRAPSSPEKNSTATNTSDPFPDLASAIPAPATDGDGTASPATLYPTPSAQPLRIYDRDTDTEHYGFYTYFDRSIFLKSKALLNFTGDSPSEIPDDDNGGAEEDAAQVRCTWTQTRFLVQIWTRRGTTDLLGNATATTATLQQGQPSNLTSSSANTFTRPGSFPYPVTVTLDRHGGDIAKKMVYCYGLDQQERYRREEKKIQLEDRGAGGKLVNPALGPFRDVKVSGDEGGPGGIDGGSGGCGCRWQNFR